jgi:hypothetical protein
LHNNNIHQQSTNIINNFYVNQDKYIFYVNLPYDINSFKEPIKLNIQKETKESLEYIDEQKINLELTKNCVQNIDVIFVSKEKIFVEKEFFINKFITLF